VLEFNSFYLLVLQKSKNEENVQKEWQRLKRRSKGVILFD